LTPHAPLLLRALKRIAKEANDTIHGLAANV
jgi:hypothetical protein